MSGPFNVGHRKLIANLRLRKPKWVLSTSKDTQSIRARMMRSKITTFDDRICAVSLSPNRLVAIEVEVVARRHLNDAFKLFIPRICTELLEREDKDGVGSAIEFEFEANEVAVWIGLEWAILRRWREQVLGQPWVERLRLGILFQRASNVWNEGYSSKDARKETMLFGEGGEGSALHPGFRELVISWKEIQHSEGRKELGLLTGAMGADLHFQDEELKFGDEVESGVFGVWTAEGLQDCEKTSSWNNWRTVQKLP